MRNRCVARHLARLGFGFENRSSFPLGSGSGTAIIRRGTRVCLILFLFLLGACVPALTKETGAPDSELIATAVAQTMAAQMTLDAGSTAVARLTEMSIATTLPPVPTQIPTLAPLASPTTSPATPTPTSGFTACDRAQFAGDVTVRDGSIFVPGAAFVKTWRIKNIGTCTWTPDYALVFVAGDPMGTLSAVSLPGSVSPGETVDLSVNLTAPGDQGTYRGEWMLQNASGELFGIGDSAQQAFWTEINVIPYVSPPEIAYDFAANFCSADWLSGTGVQPCPGTSGDSNGFVVLLDQPVLETGRAYELALWTRPNDDVNGWISGQYPYYVVEDGDRFRSEIGCLNASQGCDVTFQLQYQTSQGAVVNLGRWDEAYDGQTTFLNISLSRLAGEAVQFIASVTNNGRSSSANAFWLAPRIQNITQSTSLVLIWNRDPGDGDSCDELRVYLTDEGTGSAQALSCLDGHDEIGRSNLTRSEVDQVEEWLYSLRSFDAEVYRASSEQGVVSWIEFNGLGDANARDTHIQAINNFAEELFTQIAEVD